MRYPDHLLKLIHVLRRLPGVGNKSAERFAFHILNWSSDHLDELGDTIKEVKTHLKKCPECGCLMDQSHCIFCDPTKRDPRSICIIASSRDAFAIEETREYHGLYHVLGGLLSPIEHRGPTHLPLDKLKERIRQHAIQELVIALDSTLEGDATSLFIKQELAPYPLNISRLAFGLPMGSSLDYIDGGTLARAFTGRNKF